MLRAPHVLLLALLLTLVTARPQNSNANLVRTPPHGSLSANEAVFNGSLTNAARLKRGLAPLRPRFGSSHLPGRVPTGVETAKRSHHSGTYTGNVRINRKDTNEVVGFIKNKDSKSFGLCTDQSQASSVFFSDSNIDKMDLHLASPPDANYPYLGATPSITNAGDAGGAGDNLGSDGNYLVLTGVGHTNSGGIPSGVGNSFNTRNSESSMWSFDPNTQFITASWTNYDASLLSTALSYNPDTDSLGVTGNMAAFQGLFSSAYEVTWSLV